MGGIDAGPVDPEFCASFRSLACAQKPTTFTTPASPTAPGQRSRRSGRAEDDDLAEFGHYSAFSRASREAGVFRLGADGDSQPFWQAVAADGRTITLPQQFLVDAGAVAGLKVTEVAVGGNMLEAEGASGRRRSAPCRGG